MYYFFPLNQFFTMSFFAMLLRRRSGLVEKFEQIAFCGFYYYIELIRLKFLIIDQ